MNRITFTILFTLLGIILLVPAVRAAQPPLFQLGGDERKTSLGNINPQPVTLMDCIAGNEDLGIKAGSCGVEHIFLLANNIIRWIIGVAGAVALFMYIMGGLWMIFSGGNSGRIERGKDILIGTSIALVFILTSWLIVSFVLQSLGAKDEYTLTGVTCGSDPDCTGGLVCYKNRCVERCEAIINAGDDDPLHDWACRPPEDCGITYAICQASGNNTANCITGYCTGDQNNVCCYPKQ